MKLDLMHLDISVVSRWRRACALVDWIFNSMTWRDLYMCVRTDLYILS